MRTLHSFLIEALPTVNAISSTEDVSTRMVIFNFPHIHREPGMSFAPDSACSHLFLEALHDHFLSQHVRQPIRYRLGETPNILDLVLSNEEDIVRT